jgi:HSP20 family protein
MPSKSWLTTGNREIEPFRTFKDQLDSYFEDWFGRSIGGATFPRMDVTEDEKRLEVCLELPGVDEKDIEVSVKGDRLIVKGEKKAAHDNKDERENFVVHRIERSYGSFQRVLTVPHEIDPERVEAEFKDGLLKIALPKPEQAHERAQSRKVAIKGKASETTTADRQPDQGAAPNSPHPG